MSENVLKEVCEEKHKATEKELNNTTVRLNDHAGRIKSVEEAILVLTEMVKNQSKKSIFDKIMVISVFIMCLVLIAMVLGPEITGKIMSGVK